MAELWLVDLDQSAPALEALEQAMPRLAAQDRERALAINDPLERRRRLAAYVALRIVLERTAGIELRRQPFVRAPGGKPRLAGSGLSFSLSHAEGAALIGLARAQEIGVDLEQTRSIKIVKWRRDAIVATAAGIAGKLPDGATADAAFLQSWSRLEAFAKARGYGLAGAFADLGLRGDRRQHVSPSGIEATARRLVRAAGLEVRDVRAPPGLFAAVALAPAAAFPRLRRFPADRAGLKSLLAEARRHGQLTAIRRRGT